MVASASTASAGAGVASTGVSSGESSVGSSGVSVVSACAATSVMVAPANAGMGTSESSIQSAEWTIMRPCWSVSAEMMFTPTETSITPSAAKVKASSPSAVAEIFIEASIASGVSTLSTTEPMTLVLSWYIKTRGFFPSIGREPGLNMTSEPPLTVAQTLYGTAMASILRSPVVSPAAALTVTWSVVKWIMKQAPLVCFQLVAAGWAKRPCPPLPQCNRPRQTCRRFPWGEL